MVDNQVWQIVDAITTLTLTVGIGLVLVAVILLRIAEHLKSIRNKF
jgi:hypothetical protein